MRETIPVVGVCRSRAFCRRFGALFCTGSDNTADCSRFTCSIFPLPSVQDLPVSSFHYLLFKIYLFHLSITYCRRFTCFIFSLPSVQDLPVSSLHYLLSKIYLFHLSTTFCSRFTCFISLLTSIQDLPVPSLY